MEKIKTIQPMSQRGSYKTLRKFQVAKRPVTARKNHHLSHKTREVHMSQELQLWATLGEATQALLVTLVQTYPPSTPARKSTEGRPKPTPLTSQLRGQRLDDQTSRQSTKGSPARAV